MAKKKQPKKWIQGAIGKEGALTAQAKRAGALTSGGTIKTSWLEERAKGGSSTTARRARLALTLRRMRHKKSK